MSVKIIFSGTAAGGNSINGPHGPESMIIGYIAKMNHPTIISKRIKPRVPWLSHYGYTSSAKKNI
jgi:hypothetical protein